MSHINHFSHGALTPVLAFVMSAVGSLLGLLLTARARFADPKARPRWLLAGALSIGATGVWVMHFIAIAGFSVDDTPIRYDVWLTIASFLVAVVVVGGGLAIAAKGTTGRLLIGGLLTGVGVSAMHYLGMTAMNMSAEISYDPMMVGLSVLIAIAAAIISLAFIQRDEGALATTGAALMMAVAVNGMHYTGMFAVRVRLGTPNLVTEGAELLSFLLPLLIGVSLITLGVLLAVLLSPSAAELREDAQVVARLESRRTGTPAQAPRQDPEDGAGSLFIPQK